MTEFRELTDGERKLYTDNYVRHSGDLELYKWEAENKKRSLSDGLRISFNALKKKTEEELKQLQGMIIESQFIADDCESKLKNGVPIKEETTEDTVESE